ncbi:MAG TPA: hypothetical protein VIN10_09725 [Bacteroidales bacterium]
MEDESNESQSVQSKFESVVSNLAGDSGTPGNEDNSRLNMLTSFFNGLGVGLLLGLLLGLAVSPVVSAIIGTLSSLLVVLLGLKENYLNAVKSIRIGAFGLFCVIGILLGMYIRSNNALAPSLQSLYDEYTAMGFSEKEARNFIAYQEFDLIPSEWTKKAGSENEAEVSSENSPEESGQKILASGENIQAKKRSNVLYSSEVDAGQCYVLESSNSSMSFADIQMNFEVAGGTWKELAKDLDPSLPDNVKSSALLLLRDIFCDSGNSGKVKVKCENFQDISPSSSLADIKKTLSASGEIWNKIVAGVEKKIDSKYQKQLYLSLTKILCHD